MQCWEFSVTSYCFFSACDYAFIIGYIMTACVLCFLEMRSFLGYSHVYTCTCVLSVTKQDEMMIIATGRYLFVLYFLYGAGFSYLVASYPPERISVCI